MGLSLSKQQSELRQELDAQQYFNAGWKYYNEGDFPMAFHNFLISSKMLEDEIKEMQGNDPDKPLQYNAEYIRVLLYKGLSLQALGQFEAATKDYQTVLCIKNDNLLAMFSLAFVQNLQVNSVKNKLPGNISSEFNLKIIKILSLPSTTADDYIAQAKAHEILDDINNQIEMLKYAVMHGPNPALHFALGELYYKKEDFPNAIKYYILTTEAHPKHIIAWNKLALIYQETEKFVEAIEAATKVADLCKDTTHHMRDAYSTLAAIYYDKGDYVKAVENYQKCIIPSQDGDPLILCGLARALYKRGTLNDTNEALGCFTNAYKIYKNLPPHFKTSLHYLKMQDIFTIERKQLADKLSASIKTQIKIMPSAEDPESGLKVKNYNGMVEEFINHKGILEKEALELLFLPKQIAYQEIETILARLNDVIGSSSPLQQQCFALTKEVEKLTQDAVEAHHDTYKIPQKDNFSGDTPPPHTDSESL